MFRNSLSALSKAKAFGSCASSSSSVSPLASKFHLVVLQSFIGETRRNFSSDTISKSSSSGSSIASFIKDSKLNADQKQQLNALLKSSELGGKVLKYKLNELNINYSNLEMGSRNHIVAGVDANGNVLGFDHVTLDTLWVKKSSETSTLTDPSTLEQIPLVKRNFTVSAGRDKDIESALVQESTKDTDIVFARGDSNYGIILSFVEEGDSNTAAINQQMGMEHIGSLGSVLAHSLNVEYDKRVVAVIEGHTSLQQEVVGILQEEYAQYQVLDGSFCNFKEAKTVYQRPEPGNYFVIYKEGEIVAGAKFVAPQDLNILNCGDVTLDRVMAFSQVFGFKRTHYSKESFRSLKFDHLYAKPGHEDDLWTLMRVVASRFSPNLHWIQIVGDERDSNWLRYLGANSDKKQQPSSKFLGSFGFYSPKGIEVHAKTYGIDSAIADKIKNGPLMFPSDVAFLK
nr:unnamed protein product [Naegleria fowleri]